LGRDDNESMPFTGASGALPIWQNIFEQSGVEPLTPLADLDWAWVNAYGHPVAQDCGGIRRMPFKSGSLIGREISCAENKATSGPRTDSIEKEKQGGGSWFDWLF
jgi:penicillin-binding protein 1B